MDSRRFDSLSRLLAGAGTRRVALKAALGLFAGGGALVAGEASARPALCRPAGRYCTSNRQCCNNRCRTGKRVPIASRNICDCDAPFGMCGKMCRDLSSDPNHCGACGNQIDRETELCCDGVPTPIDGDNCHACGEVCGPDDICCGPEIGCAASCEPAATCVGGDGLGAACQSPLDCCSLACEGGVCVPPSTDCSTYTGVGVVPPDMGICFRLLGETSGSVILNSQLYCSAAEANPAAYDAGTAGDCSTDAECQAYADNEGMTGVRGFCLVEAVACFAPASCIGAANICGFTWTADATCPI